MALVVLWVPVERRGERRGVLVMRRSRVRLRQAAAAKALVSALQPPLVRPQVSETKLAGQVYADAHGGRRRGGADMSTKGQAAGGKDARKAAA